MIRTRYRLVPLVALAVLLPRAIGHAADARGTVTRPDGIQYVDASTGEEWTRVTSGAPAVFQLTGPGRFQVGMRVNLAPNEAMGTPGIVVVRTAGKPLAQFRLQPKAGTDTWKGDATSKPSVAVGFIVEVSEGKQAYEFRLNGGGGLGGAIRVVDAAQSKRPLPPNAPVVKAPPIPSATAVAVASPSAAASPAATPEATPTPVASAAAPRPRDGNPALRAWIAAGAAMRAETSVLGPRHRVRDALAGVQWNASPMLFVAGSMEWRFGTGRQLLFEKDPKDGDENRYSLGLAGGAAVRVDRFDLSAGPALWATVQQDEVLSHDYVLGGGFARLSMPAGPVDAHASGEVGVPLLDGTPQALRTGRLMSRTAWGLGVSAPMSFLQGLRFAGEYRGECLARTYSERYSHGLLLSASLDF